MAPKKVKPNAFMSFAMEWKGKYGKHLSTGEAVKEAGSIWERMSSEERKPYREKCKNFQPQVQHVEKEKLACTGKPISAFEKEQKDEAREEHLMKLNVSNLLKENIRNETLEALTFHFISVNYFIRNYNCGLVVPAEIAIAKYSLLDGVMSNYHAFTNPEILLHGYHYEALEHSKNSHKLPLPPKAKGDSDLGRVYKDILQFLRNRESGEYPILFTKQQEIEITRSVLSFLCAYDIRGSDVEFKIYPIEYLLFQLKCISSDISNARKPQSYYMTETYFERDFFEYQSDIACQYHESIDRGKYCSQSCVTRWGYSFSDYVCADFAIKMKPGRHLPDNYNIDAIELPGISTKVKARTPSPPCYEDKSEISHSRSSSETMKTDCDVAEDLDIAPSYTSEDFPALGSFKKKKTISSAKSEVSAGNVKTLAAHYFDMDKTLSGTIDISSNMSGGRGRIFAKRRHNVLSSFGRGRSFNDE